MVSLEDGQEFSFTHCLVAVGSTGSPPFRSNQVGLNIKLGFSWYSPFFIENTFTFWKKWNHSVKSQWPPLWSLIMYTDKKGNEISLICKDIQMESVAKSLMRKGFLIYEEMCKYLTIYEEAVSHIWPHNRSLLFISVAVLVYFGRKKRKACQNFLILASHVTCERPLSRKISLTVNIPLSQVAEHGTRPVAEFMNVQFLRGFGHNLESSQTWDFCTDIFNHREGDVVFY